MKATRFGKASKKGANFAQVRDARQGLKPGRYRATLVATDAAGNHSKAQTADVPREALSGGCRMRGAV